MTELLQNRFEIIEVIGRGAQATTHRALDHDSGVEVALKELDVRRLDDWKAHELFEREGETLRSLDHAAIPRYVDAFVVEESEQVRLFLAQEYVEGATLHAELANGKRWDEEQLVEDCRQLLDALIYLQSLSPPVIHRDIKPSNIIRRPDGSLALIDFGAVQNALPETVGGSTVIGTPGYMPMEQLMGRAVPATDIYALGATLVHLASRVEPSKIDVERNRLQFREVADVSDRLADVLDRMLEPSIEDRFDDADDVLAALSRSSDDAGHLEPVDEQALTKRDVSPDEIREHVRRRSRRVLPLAIVGAFVTKLATSGLGVVLGYSALVNAGSTAALVALGGWLGFQVIGGHPQLARPQAMTLRPIIPPALWLSGVTALISGAGIFFQIGSGAVGDIWTNLPYFFSNAFYTSLIVLLGYAAGCAYRVIRQPDDLALPPLLDDDSAGPSGVVLESEGERDEFWKEEAAEAEQRASTK